jgi:uncharacterized membrane protein
MDADSGAVSGAQRGGSAHRGGNSIFLPALILLLALVGWFSFQAFQLFEERSALQESRFAQEQSVLTATKLRGSLDAMARETARLAQQGNPNARLLVEELRKRGVTINPDAGNTVDTTIGSK